MLRVSDARRFQPGASFGQGGVAGLAVVVLDDRTVDKTGDVRGQRGLDVDQHYLERHGVGDRFVHDMVDRTQGR